MAEPGDKENAAVIELRGVTYRVNGAAPRALLQDISLQVHAGETVVLLGRSGSGKTTLLRLINRMLEPSAGQVIVEGRSTMEWNAIALRRHIGYVMQEAGLFPHFTVAQNVALVPNLEHWDAARIHKRIEELLQVAGLPPAEFAARFPRQLSGGQRQRVGVARALAADPPILLMDEPFGALDPVTRADLQREFQRLAKQLGKTIVFVTHDLREAMLLASRIVLLQEGRIAAQAAPADFAQIDHPEAQAFARALDGSEVSRA
jgi:osmoprotectant transport system ATP-binding protein